MGKFYLGLLLGMVIGAAVSFWYHGGGREHIGAKIPELRADDVRNELSHYGVVIKDKTKEAGTAIADATADTRATAAIKSKLATGVGASTLGNISVSTSDGVVTLAGTVSSKEEIEKAVNVAYGTEGVRKVYSTLQVKQ